MPKDAHICFAGRPMSLSNEYIKHASEFDAFRFERQRSDPKTDHNGLQFTSSYAGSLHFGYGKQMCPGRFMGSAVSKLLMIKLLQKYDFTLKEGTSRPENIMFMDMDIPEQKCEVLFRDRKL
jgi:ent-kaurene oxidase